MTNFTPLWIGTITMVLLAVILICFVLWATKTMQKFKQRDGVYMQRLDTMEDLIKVKFKNVLDLLTK